MTDRYEELLLPEQRDRIVEKVISALKSKGQLPAKTINDFRDVFRAGKPIPGFNNDPLRAINPLLKQHMLERLDIDPDLEQLIVGVWADTEPQLRTAVKERIETPDARIYESDDIDEDFLDAQVRLLADKHGEYEEDDILLMAKVCYAHAKSQASSYRESTEAAAPAQVAPSDPDAVEKSLKELLVALRYLPATLPIWRESVPNFVESVNAVITRKDEELLRVRGLTDELNRIQSAYATELSFFRHGAEEWDTLKLAMLLADANGIDKSGRIMAGLENSFQTYRKITGRANTLSEERERREKRHDLEVTIEGMLNEIDEFSHTAAVDSEPIAEPAGENQQQAQSEAASELRKELDALRLERETLLESNRALTQDADSMGEAKRALQGEVSGLNADKQALAGEVAELRDQLQISEAKELNWRNAYEAEVSSKDITAPDPIPPEIESIRQALGLARARYGDRLVYHPNSKSESDYNYRRPKEVWDALEWLAKTYYAVQTGKERVIDLNESIRNTCGGWEYKANQTDITLNTFREWYETKKDGKIYELREHLAKGTGRDANVIRIAFAWDDDSEQVIVGYVGPHQRTRNS
ncbi:MAG: hypothetical protein F4X34_02125 [Chloroflexi bacterium]|nr:hypothetical protein [Chloroflexota bacterium]